MSLPSLSNFRIEIPAPRLAHIVFDAPGRSMNVFSDAAIDDLGRIATWLRTTTEVDGAVVRSGKRGFCAGADLAELGEAYDMITGAPAEARRRLAYDHFFRLSRAIRQLETCGKPVAAALEGLALGGGYELALGCHYRVLADDPAAFVGLPESLVGLFPGAGGTQRLPRLIGMAAALPVLLDGKRLAGAKALAAGAVHAVVPTAEVLPASEAWVRAATACQQPWDRPDYQTPDAAALATLLAETRARLLASVGPHVPAPYAILDCLGRGLTEPFDRAVEIEMDIFAHLIQRPEPRNMIQTLFLGKQDWDKKADDALKAEANAMAAAGAAAVLAALAGLSVAEGDAALAFAGFTADRARLAELAAGNMAPMAPAAEPSAGLPTGPLMWFEAPQGTAQQNAARLILAAAQGAIAGRDTPDPLAARMLDYGCATALGFPVYAGGPRAVCARTA